MTTTTFNTGAFSSLGRRRRRILAGQSQRNAALVGPLRKLITRLDAIHTKAGFYNLNIAAPNLYQLRLVLHALYEDTAILMSRVGARLGGLPLQPASAIEVSQLEVPTTWQGILEDLLAEQENLMAMLHNLMPESRRVGDISTLRLLAELADYYGESILLGRAWLSEGPGADTPGETEEDNPWANASY